MKRKAWQLIHNNVCPYCRRRLVIAENLPISRSVEHLIPNSALTRKRKNDEGDFYCCRECNSRKSNLDYVIGVVAKAQSKNTELAAETMIKAVTSDDHRSKRFADMVSAARKQINGDVHMNIPVDGAELWDYMMYFAKGLYFKEFRRPLSMSANAIVAEYVNKQVLSGFEQAYYQNHGSIPYGDLENNQRSEVVEPGECVIWSKNRKYMVILHHSAALILKVLKRNVKNSKREAKAREYIIEHFQRSV